MYFVLGSFFKSIVKGAAVQIGVQAVVETAYPKVKGFAKNFLDKVHERQTKKDFEEMAQQSNNRTDEDSGEEDS